MNYLTNYYKNLAEQLQEKLNILEAQLNEVKITKFTGGQAVKFEPRVGPAGESTAEVKAGVYPGDENNRLSDEGKIRVNKENEAEAKKLRDMKRTSVETSSESPEQTAAKEKEQQRRAKWDYIESDRNDTRQGPSRGREYR